MKLIDRMVCEFKIDRITCKKAVEAFKAARDEYANSYGGHESHAIVEGLKAAESVLRPAGLRSHGVEGFCGQAFDGGSLYDSVCDYINTGDTYSATLLWDYRYRGGCLRVGCWGDVAEAYEREHPSQCM